MLDGGGSIGLSRRRWSEKKSMCVRVEALNGERVRTYWVVKEALDRETLGEKRAMCG